jgi:hypothetical protein
MSDEHKKKLNDLGENTKDSKRQKGLLKVTSDKSVC